MKNDNGRVVAVKLDSFIYSSKIFILHTELLRSLSSSFYVSFFIIVVIIVIIITMNTLKESESESERVHMVLAQI